MATQDVLLLEPIEKLGAEGDKVNVRAGYARNFLLPQKKAMPVTRANVKQIEALQRRRVEREKRERKESEDLANKLEGLSLAFSVKTGEGGKLFGSITVRDIQERLEEEGVVIDRKKIQLGEAVKTLGRHTVNIKVHPEISVELPFEVVSENPIEEAAGEENAEAAAESTEDKA